MTDGRAPRLRPGRESDDGARHVAHRARTDAGGETGEAASVDAASEHADALRRIVLRKSIQRERRRRTGTGTIWSWMGTFGLVGWTVAVPTLLGVALGAFLDGRTEGSISFTITFLVAGAAVGVTMAWYWIRRESEGDR